MREMKLQYSIVYNRKYYSSGTQLKTGLRKYGSQIANSANLFLNIGIW